MTIPILSRLVWNNGRDIDPAEVRRWGKSVEDTIDGWAWTHVQKQADETRSLTGGTAASDGELLFAMAANTKYLVKGHIRYTTDPTPDFRWALDGPASPDRVRLATWAIGHGAAAHSQVQTYTAYTGQIAMPAASGTDGACGFDGIVENGANAGNFFFGWRQNTSDAAPTTVNRGSWIAYRKVTP